MTYSEIQLGDITVHVLRKDIKNIHLSVYPPQGRVRIAAPLRLELDTIRVFAISKLVWIKQQQKKLRDQERETPREYIDRESHYVWGKRYLLRVVEVDAAPTVQLQHSKIVLHVRPGASAATKEAVVSQWYRGQIKAALPKLLSKWQPMLGVKPTRIFVQKMKTKWGGCNTVAGNIRLNTDLAKKPVQCLEYIVVHELTHLLERRHNDRFIALLSDCMPQWREYREMLNWSPLAYEEWGY